MAGTLIANTINTDTAGAVFTTQNAVTGIAKAWVNFVGSNGNINGSFNVSSVTRNGTGNYTINFTTAMPNANYVVTGTASVGDTVSSSAWWQVVSGNGPGGIANSTTQFQINTPSIATIALRDPTSCAVAVFSS